MTKKRFWIFGALLGCTLVTLAGFTLRDRFDVPGDVPLLKIQPSHKFGVDALSFSRDGNFIVSHSYESVNLSDAKTGDALPLPAAFSAKTRSDSASSLDATILAFEDPGILTGKHIVPATPNTPSVSIPIYRNKGISLYDSHSERLICTLRITGNTTGLEYQMRDVKFSPNRKRLSNLTYSPRTGFSIIVWDIESGQVLARRSTEYNSPQTGKVSLLSSSTTAFSADSRFFVAAMALRDAPQRDGPLTGRFSGKVQLFDLLTQRPLMVLNGVTGSQFAASPHFPVSFSPDGRLVCLIWRSTLGGISRSDKAEGTVYVCDLRTRQLLWKTQTQDVFPSIATFSPDSKLLAIGAMKFPSSAVVINGHLQLRDAQTGALKETFSEETGTDKWKQAWQQQQLRVRNAVPINGVIRRGRVFASGDSGPVNALAWSPDSTRLAAGYGDGSIKVWKAR